MGFGKKSKNEIINNMLVELMTNVDSINDANVGAVLRNLVEALGLEISDLYDELENVYDGTRIDTSEGEDLENLGALVGIIRKEGTEAQGNITFKRNTPIGVDFTIPSGAIVSTQPNTSEEQLRFLSIADTTFSAEIIDEEHKYVNGLYDYSMNERFIDSVSSINGIVSGSPFSFTENTDFEIIKDYNDIIINAENIKLIDDCDVTTDWNTGTGATTIDIDNVDFKEGVASLKLGKSTTITDEVIYDKVIGSVINSSNLNGYLWLKIEDSTTLNKIKYINITYGSNGSNLNSITYPISQSLLSVGWKRYKIDLTSSIVTQQGLINRNAINFFEIKIITNNVIDTISSGNIKIDYLIFSTSEDYYGDIIRFLSTGTLPDDNTNFEVTYKPLSKEVLCQAENVGVKYNSGRQKIFYKVSFISNIDNINNYVEMTGGTDIETDEDLRERIKFATELKGKATVEALRQAILGVEGVTSVSVDDMPFRTQTSELHEHTSFISTPSKKLDYEVALLDVDFEVTGTRGGSPVTFTYATDYYLEDSTIFWVNDTNDPDDGTNFFVTYNYRWLGHVNIFVAGTSTPLATEIVDNINDAIYDTKSAGIDVQWYEPTLVTVDVTANILIETTNGYLFSSVQPIVENELRIFLNSKGTGVTLYIAELIDVIMSVDGVKNTTISLPVADITVNIDEIVRPGTITINQI